MGFLFGLIALGLLATLAGLFLWKLATGVLETIRGRKPEPPATITWHQTPDEYQNYSRKRGDRKSWENGS